MSSNKSASRALAGSNLEALGDGRFEVHGVLNAHTVSALLERSEALFKGVSKLDLNLAGVTEGDSAGLALLIEWLKLAKKNRQQIDFKNIPPQIAALARISEVDDLLSIPHEPH